MAEISNIPEAMSAIRELELTDYAGLPSPVQRVLDRTAGLGSSPVDRIVQTAEAIYAHRGEVKKAAREVGAGLFTVAAMNGWHGLNENDRAHRCAAVLRGGADTNAPDISPEFSPAAIEARGDNAPE